MKMTFQGKVISALLGAMLVPVAMSHPYEGAPNHSPQAFVPHLHEDGRTVYTNIPKKCYSQGRLSCAQLHPIFKGPGTVKKD